MTAEVLLGDCLAVLPTLADASVDAIVTDPPYALTSGNAERGFMGIAWDTGRVAFNVATWREALRVAKPGAHLLAFGGTRTYHRLVCAIEDAGWIIRDTITWHHGEGYPKSTDVSKHIDRMAGVSREVVGTTRTKDIRRNVAADRALGISHDQGKFAAGSPSLAMDYPRTVPATEDAQRWSGWGTALKPATELIVLARKPLTEGTVAAQVLATGTGALNIEGCRVGTRADSPQYRPASASGIGNGGVAYGTRDGQVACYAEGRWPPNLLLSHSEECTETACHPSCPVAELDRQSGVLKSGAVGVYERQDNAHVYRLGFTRGLSVNTSVREATEGGASRFFPVFRYEAKASRSERDRGVGGKPLLRLRADLTPEQRLYVFEELRKAGVSL